MNTNDKNYVDRLYNQQVNELNEVKNRLLILEGKSTVTTDGNIRVEIDTDKIYEILLRAYEDCLQQRQERRQEEYRKAAVERRKECEAKGEQYFTNDDEWRAAVIRDYREFFRTMSGLAKIADRHYRDIRAALLKLLGESHTDTDTPKQQSLFSKLPSGVRPKIHELRRRITNRIRNYLSGNFTFPRGWTILTVLLYSLSFILILYFRITIMVSG